MLFIDKVEKHYKVVLQPSGSGFTTYFNPPHSKCWYRFSLPVRADREDAESDLKDFAEKREWRRAG